jgi:hypothetical protein
MPTIELLPTTTQQSQIKTLRQKEPMKRILTILTIVIASLTISPRAFAESSYFGVRGDLFLPITSTNGSTNFAVTGIVLPLFGFQGGYDFSDRSEPGFSLRGTFKTLFFISEISVDALYRIPDETTAGWYFGVGGDLVFVLVISAQSTIFGGHAVVGYNFPLSEGTSVFLEAVPGLFANSTGGLFYLSLAGGFNFHF